MEYKNILIGTDGGDLMAPVYDNAAYFARLTGATVHIAYVLDVAGFTAYPVDSSWENMYDVLLAEGKNIVASAKKDLASRGINDDRIITTVLDGHPAEELDTYAGSHNIDLIVIGSHGRKGLDRLLIGSVADKVVRGAKVPVLIVRSQ
ncbi:MAG TPA: universal stress protein [Candidatus Bathyarchaeia archaeon]|nr:universal stress protein [Candidatus Bathyarchaeia archaeon]